MNNGLRPVEESYKEMSSQQVVRRAVAHSAVAKAGHTPRDACLLCVFTAPLHVLVLCDVRWWWGRPTRGGKGRKERREGRGIGWVAGGRRGETEAWQDGGEGEEQIGD